MTHSSLKDKWREICIFACMLFAFVVFTSCPKNFEDVDKMPDGFMKNMCENKQDVLMWIGGVLVCLIAYKFIKSKKENALKKKQMAELIKKQK